jgi:hypothetical protein
MKVNFHHVKIIPIDGGRLPLFSPNATLLSTGLRLMNYHRHEAIGAIGAS